MHRWFNVAAGSLSNFVVILVVATRRDLELTTSNESSHHVTGWRPEHAALVSLSKGRMTFVVSGTGTSAKFARFAGKRESLIHLELVSTVDSTLLVSFYGKIYCMYHTSLRPDLEQHHVHSIPV